MGAGPDGAANYGHELKWGTQRLDGDAVIALHMSLSPEPESLTHLHFPSVNVGVRGDCLAASAKQIAIP